VSVVGIDAKQMNWSSDGDA